MAELEMTVPLPVEHDRAADRMGRWCARLGALWYRRWTGEFYRAACADCAAARERAQPFWPWRARLSAALAYEDDRVCSLWMEGGERQGREEGRAVRTAATWTRQDGFPLTLGELFPWERHWRGQVLAQVREGLRGMREEGIMLWKDAERLAETRFSAGCFFLTPAGLRIYFPTGALGPNESGIIEFLLPLEQKNQTLDGQKNPEKV